MTAPRDVVYEPLLVADGVDIDDEEKDSPRHPRKSSRGLRTLLADPRTFLLACCGLALMIATLNLTVLSAHDALNAYASARGPEKRPSVYEGLQYLKYKNPRCRNRTTYPSEYWSIEGDDVLGRQRVHAPKDEVMFGFGDTRSAYLTFYIPDFGLENCTFTFRTGLPTPRKVAARGITDAIIKTPADYMKPKASIHVGEWTMLEVYRLEGPDTLAGRIMLDSLSTHSLDQSTGGEVTTRPFYCKAQSKIAIQVVCLGACQVEFGLEGMTTASHSSQSADKTGFSLQQYENASCVQ